MGLGAGAERQVLDTYRRPFDDPEAVQAMCEDYRAGASIDIAHDEADRAAGRRVACPVQVLWGQRGALPVFYDDVLAVWRPWAADLSGAGIDASHFVPEDAPDATAAAILAFNRD